MHAALVLQKNPRKPASAGSYPQQFVQQCLHRINVSHCSIVLHSFSVMVESWTYVADVIFTASLRAFVLVNLPTHVLVRMDMILCFCTTIFRYIGELSPGGALPTTFSTPLRNLSVLWVSHACVRATKCQLICEVVTKEGSDVVFVWACSLILGLLTSFRVVCVLCHRYLRNCQLTGSIPSSINILSGLQYL